MIKENEMGYRHQVISNITKLNKNNLPKWFTEKYEKLIDFDRKYWASNYEYKRYFSLTSFNSDIQKMLSEVDKDVTIRLVYFANESNETFPDIIHTTITASSVKEITPDGWDGVLQ